MLGLIASICMIAVCLFAMYKLIESNMEEIDDPAGIAADEEELHL